MKCGEARSRSRPLIFRATLTKTGDRIRILVYAGENVSFTAKSPSAIDRFDLKIDFQKPFVYDPSAGGLLLDLHSIGEYVGRRGAEDSDWGEDRSGATIGHGFDGPAIFPLVTVLRLEYFSIPKVSAMREGDVIKIAFFADRNTRYALQTRKEFVAQEQWLTVRVVLAEEPGLVSSNFELKGDLQYFRVVSLDTAASVESWKPKS